MNKTYNISVDCINCANTMEDIANNTPGVIDAAVSFMTQKLEVEFEDGQDDKKVMTEVLKACREVEPDCKPAP